MSARIMKSVMAAAAVSFTAAAVPASAAVDAAVLPAVVSPEPTRAEQLRAEAERYFTTPRYWGRAARLLERSASLRDAADAETYHSLMIAGNLRASMAEYQTAQSNYEKAAAHAAARGAVLDAAHAYINAAHAAVRAGSNAGARENVDRARLMASSPLLSAAQKEQITRRLDVRG